MKIGEMLSKIGATIPPIKPTLYQQLIEAAARVAAKPSPFHMGTPARRRGPQIERPKGVPVWSFSYTRRKGKVARPAWTYRGARRNALFQRGIECPS
jgi:hypothetical protein